MHILSQKVLGLLIVLLLAILVVTKRISTGSILEKLKGGLLLWLVNIFNLLFLLIINPFAAILLIMEKMETADPGFLFINDRSFLLIVEYAGLIIYLFGFILMAWALIRLGMNYQLGGVDPRATDKMVTSGPYKYIRHPMYTAALSIALGLSFLIQSVGCFIAFCIYLILILMLVPKEEESLAKAYSESYNIYRSHTNKLIPFLY